MTDTATRERPILFSGAMVRAILSGEKTQTRRAVKPQPVERGRGAWEFGGRMFASDEEMRDHLFHEVYGVKGTPYGALRHEGGDRLWVRETWRPAVAHTCGLDACDCADVNVTYAADGASVYVSEYDIPAEWEIPAAARKGNVPSIHMPRWASRTTLEITNVRVERLQEISLDDCLAEGILATDHWRQCRGKTIDGSGVDAGWEQFGREVFRDLWDSINAARGFGWAVNPWCWCIEFKRLEADNEA